MVDYSMIIVWTCSSKIQFLLEFVQHCLNRWLQWLRKYISTISGTLTKECTRGLKLVVSFIRLHLFAGISSYFDATSSIQRFVPSNGLQFLFFALKRIHISFRCRTSDFMLHLSNFSNQAQLTSETPLSKSWNPAEPPHAKRCCFALTRVEYIGVF